MINLATHYTPEEFPFLASQLEIANCLCEIIGDHKHHHAILSELIEHHITYAQQPSTITLN